MKTIVLATLCAVAVLAVPVSKDAILGGALCLPCVQLIKNGETTGITDFNTWFTKEVTALCKPLGVLSKECVMYFNQYEQDFDNFITNKADPRTSCESIDFCDKSKIYKPYF